MIAIVDFYRDITTIDTITLHDLSQHVYDKITKISNHNQPDNIHTTPIPNQITFIPHVNANRFATI